MEEICLVTQNRERTARGPLRLGIGPWRFMEIDPGNTSEQMYRGREVPFTIQLAFAQIGKTVFELMQPMDDNSIFAEHLKSKGEGLHHASFSLKNGLWSDRIADFKARGFPVVQSGP